MAWRDQLRPASFRGVAFQVDGEDRNAGRRVQTHEFARRDVPYTEDLGRAARRYQVSAYVIGADYLDHLNRLLEALEAPGPGDLVHPYYGTVRVLADGSGTRVTHSDREGGLARLALGFVEAGQIRYPADQPSTAAQLTDRADALALAAAASFAASFTVAGWPAFVAEEAGAFLGKLAITPPATVDPAGVLGAVTGWAAALDVEGALGALAQTWPLPMSTATPSRQRIYDNAVAIRGLAQDSALEALARDAAGRSWLVYDDAVADLGRVTDAIGGALLEADDTRYEPLRALRAATVAHIRRQATGAGRLAEYTPPQDLPALVIAHRLYGDATRDAEIIARNAIRAPGFAAGALQVVEA